MNYVRLSGSEVIYPYTITDLRLALRRGDLSENGESIHLKKDPTDSDLAEFKVFPVEPSDNPAGDVVSDYCAYDGGRWVQRWNARSFTPEEATAITLERRQGMAVSMAQAQLAMLDRGILANVEPAIAQMPSPEKEQAQIVWAKSATVKRLDPLVTSLGVMLGLSDDDIDGLFDLAETL